MVYMLFLNYSYHDKKISDLVIPPTPKSVSYLKCIILTVVFPLTGVC